MTSSQNPSAWPLQSIDEALSDGIFIDGDWVESKDQDPKGDVRLVQLADIGDGLFRDKSRRFLTSEKASELRCTYLEPGDVLVARMPHPLGRAALFPGVDMPAVTAVDVCILRPSPRGPNSKWLMYAINSPQFRQAISALARGTTRGRISRKNLGALMLPLPSREAQDRVVALIDKLLGHLREVEDRIHDGTVTMGRVRRSAFAAGCLGRLTTETRPLPQRSRSLSGEEPSIELSAHPNELPDLPAGWAWHQLQDVADSVQYGFTATARKEPIGPKLLRITDVQNGRVDWDAVPYCRIDSEDEQRFLLSSGDIVFARTGATTGKSYLISASPRAVFASYLIRVRPKEGISSEYLACFFQSAMYWSQITDRTIGTGQPNCNASRLRALWVAVPPSVEQADIVSRIGEVVSAAEAVERELKGGVSQIERSRRAVLAKAFRGELFASERSGVS